MCYIWRKKLYGKYVLHIYVDNRVWKLKLSLDERTRIQCGFF